MELWRVRNATRRKANHGIPDSVPGVVSEVKARQLGAMLRT
jgi:hypothetical protein